MLTMKASGNKIRTAALALFSFVITFVLILLMFIFQGIGPFGPKTLAWGDGGIQYVDFLLWLRRVLSGQDSLAYSFSAGPGQNTIGIFSYYLSSPLDLLVIFTDPADIFTFFNFLVGLKLAVSSVSASIFLSLRFKGEIPSLLNVLLSTNYGLMLFNLEKGANIMWLDGVIMLPWILLGVWKLVESGKGGGLSIAVGAAILFNWYSAAIDCLFAGLWFFLELGLLEAKTGRRFGWFVIKRLLLFILYMVIGIMLSSILFVPTIRSMMSTKAQFDGGVMSFEWTGNPFYSLENYTFNGVSDSGKGANVFAGYIPMILALSVFVRKKWGRSQIILLLFSFVFIAIYHLQAASLFFSLFKQVDSYLYRYSYGTSFFVIFLAGWALTHKNGLEKHPVYFLLISCLLTGLMAFGAVHNGSLTESWFVLSVLSCLIDGLLLGFYFNHTLCRTLSTALLITAVLVQDCMGVVAAWRNHSTDAYQNYPDYYRKAEELLKSLKNDSDDPYRISWMTNRLDELSNVGRETTLYNESMSFGFMGISSYTSMPNERTLHFYEKNGYKITAHCITVVNYSILPIDSLLSVKYVVSSIPTDGLQRIKDCGNGICLYENPYKVPMAFLTGDIESWTDSGSNPFEIQNEIYSSLMGRPVILYRRLDSQTVVSDPSHYVFSVEGINDRESVYGKITADVEGIVGDGSFYEQSYGRWLSPTVFSVPAYGQQAQVTFTSDSDIGMCEGEFYALDLEELGLIAQELNQKAATFEEFKNGKVICEVDAEQKGNIFLSIPYETGFQASVNGEKVPIKTFDDMFIMIPVEEGENHIELFYHLPGLRKGAVISAGGIFFLLIVTLVRKKASSNNYC